MRAGWPGKIGIPASLVAGGVLRGWMGDDHDDLAGVPKDADAGFGHGVDSGWGPEWFLTTQVGGEQPPLFGGRRDGIFLAGRRIG